MLPLDNAATPAGINGGSDPSQQAFASGILAGAGLRELSQVLGLSKRRQGMARGGATPSSANLLAGNMGDMDRILLLAKMQGLMGGPAEGPSPVPPMPAQPPIGGMPPVPPVLPPLPGGPMPGGLPMPGAPPMGPGPGGPPMPGANPFGGELPMQLLQQMLGGAAGIV